MDDLLCDQTKAYQGGSTAGTDLPAVTLYEQLKEAIEAVGKTLAEDEKLLTVWHDPVGGTLWVDHIGYHNQTLMVFRGRDVEGAECTALVPAQTAQLVLKKVKKLPSEVSSSVKFMGHSVAPESQPEDENRRN